MKYKKLLVLTSLLLLSPFAISLNAYNNVNEITHAEEVEDRFAKIEMVRSGEGFVETEYDFGTITVYELDSSGQRHSLSYTYKLFDIYSKDVTDRYRSNGRLYTGASGNICFKAPEEGRYSLKVYATSSTGRNSEKAQKALIDHLPHYPVFARTVKFAAKARNNEKYYYPEAKASYEDESGTSIPIPDSDIHYGGYFFDAGNNRHDISPLLDSETNRYYFVPNNYASSIADGVGSFYLWLTATNSYGTSTMEREINSKYANSGEIATEHTSVYNAANWSSNSANTINSNQVTLSGTTFYKGGLPIEKGVEMDFKINSLPSKDLGGDPWISFALTTKPGISCTYSETIPGLHFRFFYTGGFLKTNIRYMTEEGSTTLIQSDYVVTTGLPEKLSLKVKPFDVKLNPDLSDNITITFNGSQLDMSSYLFIERSTLQDDEGFVYFSFVNSESVSINVEALNYSDTVAPEITVNSDIPTQINVNTDLTLPNARARDNRDGDIVANLSEVQKPSGRTATVINNVFKVNEIGTYVILYSAVDSSDNVAIKRVEVVVVNPEYQGKTMSDSQRTILVLTGVIAGCVALGIVGLHFLSSYLKYKKLKKEVK